MGSMRNWISQQRCIYIQPSSCSHSRSTNSNKSKSLIFSMKPPYLIAVTETTCLRPSTKPRNLTYPAQASNDTIHGTSQTTYRRSVTSHHRVPTPNTRNHDNPHAPGITVHSLLFSTPPPTNSHSWRRPQDAAQTAHASSRANTSTPPSSSVAQSNMPTAPKSASPVPNAWKKPPAVASSTTSTPSSIAAAPNALVSATATAMGVASVLPGRAPQRTRRGTREALEFLGRDMSGLGVAGRSAAAWNCNAGEVKGMGGDFWVQLGRQVGAREGGVGG